MEIRHLKYFTAAAEELNISHAARRLNVSQPAMSRTIHDLESELGVPLFVQERFGLRLTTSGEKLLIYTRQILDIINEAVRVIGNIPDANCVINIGFIASSINTFLGAALRSFRSANPNVVIKIHELSPASQIKALRKHQIDIALIGNPSGSVRDEFETEVLFELQLEAVIPESHRLAQRKLINLKELVEDEFIGYNEESFPGRNQTIINACLVAGFKPVLSYQADSLVEVLAIVGSGAGVCLMPADVASLPHPEVKFIPVREKLETIRFTAAWQRDDARSIIGSLLDHIKRQK
ncbi:MAG: LysR family transcriptional regulator [Desulfuromonadales bacterium]|nr:LysR family transcriptional regulator [Desulfuromonadales bacterium]